LAISVASEGGRCATASRTARVNARVCQDFMRTSKGQESVSGADDSDNLKPVKISRGEPRGNPSCTPPGFW